MFIECKMAAAAILDFQYNWKIRRKHKIKNYVVAVFRLNDAHFSISKSFYSLWWLKMAMATILEFDFCHIFLVSNLHFKGVELFCILINIFYPFFMIRQVWFTEVFSSVSALCYKHHEKSKMATVKIHIFIRAFF